MEIKCTVCGKVMMGRADRKFCSAACRQKAYRTRESEPVEWTPTDAEFLTDIRQALQMMPGAVRQRNLSPRAVQIVVDDARDMIAMLTEIHNVMANHNVTAGSVLDKPTTQSRKAWASVGRMGTMLTGTAAASRTVTALHKGYVPGKDQVPAVQIVGMFDDAIRELTRLRKLINAAAGQE